MIPTRAELLASRDLSPVAKLLAIELFKMDRRIYSAGELGALFGCPGSWVAEAGRELSRMRVGILIKHSEASTIEWNPKAWKTPQQDSAKVSKPSQKPATSSPSVQPSSSAQS